LPTSCPREYERPDGTHALAWRVTVGDADVVIEPGEANLRRLQEALAGLAVRPQTVSAVHRRPGRCRMPERWWQRRRGGDPGCAPVITMLPTAGVVDSVIANDRRHQGREVAPPAA